MPQVISAVNDAGATVSDRGRNGAVTTTLAWTPLILLFAAYPVALVVPVRAGVPLTYEWALPTFQCATLFGLLALVCQPPASSRTGRVPVYAALVACLAVPLLSAAVHSDFDIRSAASMAGYIAVPLYFATCRRSGIPRSLPAVLALLWAVHCLHGIWQVTAGFQVVGVTGNRNWMGALVVALAPWVAVASRSLRTGRFGLSNQQRTVAAAAAAVAVAAFLWWHTRCRATVVALGAYGVWWVVWRLPAVRWRVLFGIGLCAAAVGFGWWQQDRLRAAVRRDIRLPCWTGTAAMIADHPWLGVGPGQFRRDFPAYRTPQHKSRQLAGDITEHSHNQFLFLAATAGIPYALLWLLLLVPLLLPVRGSPYWRAVHFMTFILVAHGMLDKQLVQPPTDLLVCVGIGLLWRPRLRTHSAGTASPANNRHPAGTLRALPLLSAVAMLMLAFRVDLPAGTARRSARIAERDGEYTTMVREYSFAGRVGSDPTDFYLAGMAALQHLNNPVLGLSLLRLAVSDEPYIGHVHRYAGLALGRLGEHENAMGHFALESHLYPFHAPTRQLLYNARIHAGRLKGLPELAEDLGDLRYRTLIRAYGEQHAHALTASFAAAARNGDAAAAAKAADRLLAPLAANMLEPLVPGSPAPPAEFRPSPGAQFTPSDLAFWRSLVAGREHSYATVPADRVVRLRPAEYRCRNQALAQLLSRTREPFRECVPLSPAARVERAFQKHGRPPEVRYVASPQHH